MSYEWIIEKDTQEWEVKEAYNKYLKAKKSSNNHMEYNRWFDYWFDYLHTRDKFINRYEK